jgi:hypothetical protein
VFVRQFRPGIGAVHYELPAGVVEAGEAIEAAARRELLEETGFSGGTWSLLANLSANPALQNNMTATFLAEGVSEHSPARARADRGSARPPGQGRRRSRLIDSGDMIQALHAAPLLRYLLKRARR